MYGLFTGIYCHMSSFNSSAQWQSFVKTGWRHLLYYDRPRRLMLPDKTQVNTAARTEQPAATFGSNPLEPIAVIHRLYMWALTAQSLHVSG